MLTLEQRVVKAIKEGHRTFTDIDIAARTFYENNFRMTDRALQRLRRVGRLKWTSKNGWEINAK